jgi:CheY-like chemotaxis protein
VVDTQQAARSIAGDDRSSILHSSRHKPIVDALRLSEAQRQELIAKLDRQAASYRGMEARLEDRVPYVASAGVMLTLHHPGGSVANYLVRPRNLSRRGVGFLHGNFIHVGSRCQVYLLRLDGRRESISGVVVRCSHVQGLVHEVGVRFDNTIDLGEFLADYSHPAEEPQQSVELPRLSGKTLYVEDSANDQELLRFHLDNLGVEMVSITSPLEALQVVEREQFDLVAVGIRLPGMTGPEFAAALRADGYEGPIIALTAEDSAEIRSEAMASGCNAVYVKPFTLEHVVQWFAEHLPRAGTKTGDDQCLISTEWGNERMRPLILGFVERMQGQVDELARLLQVGKDHSLIQKLSLDLKGSAGGYGYPDVSRVAADLHRLSATGASAKDIAEKCCELADLCQRAGRIRQQN